MTNEKKVLILTITCGEGHNSMAKAIASEIQNQGSIAKIVDLFESDPKRLKSDNDNYLWCCKNIPHLYNIGWHIARKLKPKKLMKSIKMLNVKKFINPIKIVVDEFCPDAIVCVHNVAGTIISYLKQQNLIDNSIKTYTLMFDYVLCPQWHTNVYLDYCITPTEFCHKDLINVGFEEKQLKCLGFAVNSKFCKRQDKVVARKELGLEDKFTFFSIAGGNGLGSSLKLLKQILKTKGDYQVIIVCGKNAKEKQKIDDFVTKNSIKNVKNYGFVNNINQLMNASDIAFSRGGGNSVSECLYSGLPIIFRRGLIINEKENEKIFVKMGFAYSPKSNRDITKICQFALDNPKIIYEQQQKILEFIKPNPTQNIAKFILN